MNPILIIVIAVTAVNILILLVAAGCKLAKEWGYLPGKKGKNKGGRWKYDKTN